MQLVAVTNRLAWCNSVLFMDCVRDNTCLLSSFESRLPIEEDSFSIRCAKRYYASTRPHQFCSCVPARTPTETSI